ACVSLARRRPACTLRTLSLHDALPIWLGKEKFAKKLALELDAGLSAAEVLHSAEREFARVEREMYTIARQLWGKTFPKAPLPPRSEEHTSELQSPDQLVCPHRREKKTE